MQNFLQRMYIAEFIEVGNKWLNCGDFLLNVIREERFFLQHKVMPPVPQVRKAYPKIT